jgi:CRISPR/Cas system-associated exonuclease Cas4 (RecB family)
MKKLLSLKNWTIIAITAALLFVTAFSAQPASASSDFNLEVTHLINGNDLGLDRNLPVDVYINGSLAIPDFRFGEKVETSLSAGWYTITVFLTDGTPLPSMTVGPVNIPAGVDVSIKARLNTLDTPYLQVNAAAAEAAMPSDGTFNVTVRHSIDGRKLGLASALPVNVYINGNLAISGFEFGDKVETSLRAGTYNISVTLADGTPLPSMSLSGVEIPAGADIIINAKLTADKTPILFARAK